MLARVKVQVEVPELGLACPDLYRLPPIHVVTASDFGFDEAGHM